MIISPLYCNVQNYQNYIPKTTLRFSERYILQFLLKLILSNTADFLNIVILIGMSELQVLIVTETT